MIPTFRFLGRVAMLSEPSQSELHRGHGVSSLKRGSDMGRTCDCAIVAQIAIDRLAITWVDLDADRFAA